MTKNKFSIKINKGEDRIITITITNNKKFEFLENGALEMSQFIDFDFFEVANFWEVKDNVAIFEIHY